MSSGNVAVRSGSIRIWLWRRNYVSRQSMTSVTGKFSIFVSCFWAYLYHVSGRAELGLTPPAHLGIAKEALLQSWHCNHRRHWGYHHRRRHRDRHHGHRHRHRHHLCHDRAIIAPVTRITRVTFVTFNGNVFDLDVPRDLSSGSSDSRVPIVT